MADPITSRIPWRYISTEGVRFYHNEDGYAIFQILENGCWIDAHEKNFF